MEKVLEESLGVERLIEIEKFFYGISVCVLLFFRCCCMRYHAGAWEREKDAMNSSAFKMASSAMSLMSDKSISYSWRVEVRLDIDGVDIATSQKVFVNMDNINM